MDIYGPGLPDLNARIAEVRERHAPLFDLSEADLRAKLKPTELDERLRESIWYESRISQRASRRPQIGAALAGHMPSIGYFVKFYLAGETGALRTVFLLTPTQDPEILASIGLVKGIQYLTRLVDEPEFEEVDDEPLPAPPPPDDQDPDQAASGSPDPSPPPSEPREPAPVAIDAQEKRNSRKVKREIEKRTDLIKLKLKAIEQLTKLGQSIGPLAIKAVLQPQSLPPPGSPSAFHPPANPSLYPGAAHPPAQQGSQAPEEGKKLALSYSEMQAKLQTLAKKEEELRAKAGQAIDRKPIHLQDEEEGS